MVMRILVALLCAAAARAQQLARLPTGTIDAVYELLERVLPGESAHFSLSFADDCGALAAPCYAVSTPVAGDVVIIASGANELSAGLGAYLREVGLNLNTSKCR